MSHETRRLATGVRALETTWGDPSTLSDQALSDLRDELHDAIAALQSTERSETGAAQIVLWARYNAVAAEVERRVRKNSLYHQGYEAGRKEEP